MEGVEVREMERSKAEGAKREGSFLELSASMICSMRELSEHSL